LWFSGPATLKTAVDTPYSNYVRISAIRFSIPNMQIVYSSQHYQVVQYAGIEGYEVINKPAGVGTYLQGEVAAAFRQSLAKVVAEDPSVDSIDDFLGGFDALMNQPAVMH
jgi:hypothetical protein